MKRILLLCILALTITVSSAHPDDTQSARPEPIGYRDADGDGKNDLFRDTEGDGKNDVTGESYPHSFRFRDANGDGLNDLFRDANGDGLNDLTGRSGKKLPAGSRERAVDADGDGVNDITGKRYAPRAPSRRFVDEDADGLRDSGSDSKPPKKVGAAERKVDHFDDGDDDGINDGRGIGLKNRKRLQEMEDRGLKGKGGRPGRGK